jgi:hypothetical protein
LEIQQSSGTEGGDSDSSTEGTTEETQRVAGEEMMGNRGHRDKGYEEMRTENCGSCSVEEIQRSAKP